MKYKYKLFWRANPHGKKLCATLSGIKSELAKLSNVIEGIPKYLMREKNLWHLLFNFYMI